MARNYIALLLIVVFFFQSSLQAQEKSFVVKFINEPITLDGTLDEGAWLTAESANNFQQYFPTDSVLAVQQSNIKMLYDE